MANFYTPACGDRIKLIRPWHLNLILDKVNQTFVKAFGLVLDYNNLPDFPPYHIVDCVIPSETILECDKIHTNCVARKKVIRHEGFAKSHTDHIVWKIILNNKIIRNHKFWAELSECNNIIYDQENIFYHQIN